MSPKVLFIGHYCEDSGWGVAGREYLHAMISAGIDVTARPVFAGNPVKKLPPEIFEVTKKSAEGCEVVIQNVLPHIMDYSGRFKRNIALCYTETYNYSKAWVSKLNSLDELWVPCTECGLQATQSGVKIPQKLVPTPIDNDIFVRSYEKASLRAYPGDFKFYFIGENIKRKGLTNLLTAYYLQFTSNDNVSLIIKTNTPGKSPPDSFNDMQQMVKVVQQNMKLYPEQNNDLYPRVEVITDKLSNEDIYSLHDSADVFCMPSFGEGWNLPAITALGFGNPVIATAGIGLTDFVTDENSFLVPSTETPVVGMINTGFSDLFTSRERWRQIDILNLARAMGITYSWRESSLWKLKQHHARESVKRFDRKDVGKQIRELIL